MNDKIKTAACTAENGEAEKVSLITKAKAKVKLASAYVTMFMARTFSCRKTDAAGKAEPTLFEKTKGKVAVASAYATVGIAAVYASAPLALAADDTSSTNLVTRLQTMGQSIYQFILLISSVVAAVVVAYCLLMMLLSKDEKKVSQSMDWLKRAIICWVAIFLVTSIFNWVINSMGLSSNENLLSIELNE